MTTKSVAYQAPKEEECELTATLIDPTALYVDKPIKTVDGKYGNLRELQNLAWTDTFFDDEEEEDIIAVFDFDYDAMEEFYTSVGWATIGSSILYAPIFVLQLIGLGPCYLRKNVQWSTRSQHVAITRDGIRFVREKRSCCWGMSCTDQGKTSKTVPFDKITDCDITEPAGNTCICVPNVLSVVNIDTASSGQDGQKELRLAGLKDPHTFKKLVWAMKRAQHQQGTVHAPSTSSMTGRGAASKNEDDAVTVVLLREIRDELRTNNELLQKSKDDVGVDTMSTSDNNAPLADVNTINEQQRSEFV